MKKKKEDKYIEAYDPEIGKRVPFRLTKSGYAVSTVTKHRFKYKK